MNANCAARLAVSAVSASVEQEGNEAPHAIDGSLATRWSGKGIGATLTADLGALRQLCGVGLGWYVGDTRSNTFTLETSTDGTTFTRVFSGTSARTTALQTVGFAQTSARWLRLAVLGNTENTWASVTELQPFGATPFVLRQRPGPTPPTPARE
ncbi:MAG: discoidin domain-containing protein [Archangiaceae bacterium]|nr:discoidin domain-containing protein [Archangiaceae bacterium]